MSDPDFQERILYAACPLCASPAISHFHTGDGASHRAYNPALSAVVNWMRCATCDHVFTEGYYSDAALKILFQTTQTNQGVGDGIEKNRHVSARMIDKLTPFQDSGVWLDVGFGNGSLIFTADEYGFETVGLDLRAQTVSALRNLGFECHQQDICAFTYERPISVISMADVLEHTHFPAECLRAAHRLLGPDGVLFMSMPNADSFLWKTATAQGVNPFWGELEHYHNFTRKRLYALLEETGFTPRRYSVSERYRMCMEVIATKKP